MANQLVLLLPEVFLSVLALAIFVGETFAPALRKTWLWIAIAGLAVVVAHQACFFSIGHMPWAEAAGITPSATNGGWIQYPIVYGMIAVDSLAAFFKVAIAMSVILVLWLSADYREFDQASFGTYAGLLLMAAVGMMLLVGSVDFLIAVIALELLSIASFILTGYVFRRASSAEGAIKFLLVGTLSTGILLFGISYYYGYFGTTRLEPLLQLGASGPAGDLVLALILVFLISGLGFKLAMAPFHMWAPDAYEGAPTPITAFLSVAPKTAAIGFLLRLLANHEAVGLTPLLAVLAAITMTVGNLGALQQTNVKRLLAYSSIAQVGYILVALVAGGSLGSQAAMVYTFIYLFMNMGVFVALIAISNQNKSDDVSSFAGLHQKSMGLSLALVLFLLSMTGIPPLAGFAGKFAIFAAVIAKPHLLWLGIVAIVNSVISLYYYFRIVQQVFFKEPSDAIAPRLSPALVCALVVTLGVTVIGGVFPNEILGWVRNVVGS